METYTRAEAVGKIELTKIPVGDSEKNIIAQNLLVNAMDYGWQTGGCRILREHRFEPYLVPSTFQTLYYSNTENMVSSIRLLSYVDLLKIFID